MGILFNIQRYCVDDGPGIRTTVFLKGCNLNCAWCHNPESREKEPQMLVYKNKCTGCGKCQEVCPNDLKSCSFCGKCAIYCPNDARKVCGKEYTPDEVFGEIIKDKTFYENSGGGVTFSGGECMLQIDFLFEVLKLCKENGIHTAVDTAGHVPFQSFESIIPYTDLFLYDVKSMDCDTHRKYTGVGNELILENLKKLLARKVHIWVRVPVVSGVNDTRENFIKMKAFFEENGYPEKIELLPYHTFGQHKYEALGKRAAVFETPTQGKIDFLKRLVEPD